MTMLHEILAIETTAEGHFKASVPEMADLFKNKVSRFNGHVRTLKLTGEETPDKIESEKAESETVSVTTSVPEELDYLGATASKFFDIIVQKDTANANAKADVEIDGVVILKDVPATTLLALENKFKYLRTVYEQIPTLQPGATWSKDPAAGRYIYKDINPEVRAKTKNSFDFKVLVPPTDKFPAQIEKWNSTVDIGYFTKIRWSGMISVADKSKLLARFDSLAMAFKRARQRANLEKVSPVKIGQTIFEYLHQDILS